MAVQIITRRQLPGIVPYSLSHIARLERAGRFPRRVRLGPCRVGWVEAEVRDWLAARVAERDNGSEE